MSARPPRHYRHYTPDELATIESMLGHASIDAIAQSVGRAPGAVARHLIYVRGRSISATLDDLGMTPERLMSELGVSKITVQAWLRRGLLAHTKRVQRKRTVTIISRAAVRAFIQSGGLIGGSARPREPWHTLADQTAARWAAEYISAPDVCQAIGYGESSLYWLKRAHGFPEPAVPRVSCRPHYYSRAAVRAWLIIRPQFNSAHARLALGLTKEGT